MERLVEDLVNRFEQGGLTRRQLIQGLALLAAPTAASAQNAAPPPQGVSIHHVQISVAARNMARSRAFYETLCGAKLHSQRDTPPTMHLSLGPGPGRLSFKGVDGDLAGYGPPGVLHHFAIGIDNFDPKRLAEAAKRAGSGPVNAAFSGSFTANGGFVTDPNGILVQIVGKDWQEPDAQKAGL